jgi:hypothetical protein
MAGLNIKDSAPHSAQDLLYAGADAVRIVLTGEYDLTQRFQEYRQRGMYALGVIASESDDGYRDHKAAMREYNHRYAGLLSAVQVGNESDLEDSPSSWTMTQRDLARLGYQAREAFGPDMPLVCAGMASGQPGWLDSLDRRWCNYLAVQPYAKDMSLHPHYRLQKPGQWRYAAAKGDVRTLNCLISSP